MVNNSSGVNTSGNLFQTSLTTNGVVYTAASGVLASTASTATAGQALLSGSSAAPVWSTATYPSTAGTSLNLLQSDGTNFVSTAPILMRASGNISSANWKLSNTNPITMVSAPASGKVIRVVGFTLKLNYGGTNVFTAGGSVNVKYTNSSGSTVSNFAASSYTGSVTSVTIPAPNIEVDASTTAAGASLVLLTTSNPAGNAAGDNTIDWSVVYYIDF